MAYSDFLKNIDTKFNNLFDEISAEYNFDNGPEFEIALCKVLRFILPNKYGICRGFAVTSNGDTFGDDIIIYDQERFPTLRLLEDLSFSQKQKIPIEAIYMYIEAKHTLCLEGDGGQSLLKAVSQVKAIKEIQRKKVPLNQITPNTRINNYNPTRPKYWPDYFNPIYGAIISRHVRIKQNQPIVDIDDFLPVLRIECEQLAKTENPPDLIIAGSDTIVIPSINKRIESPFFMNNISDLAALESRGTAFGNGLTNMMYALDHIQLGKIHWPTIIADGLKLFLNNPPENE